MTQSTVLFDNDCSKCSRWANFIETRDPRSRFRIIGQNTVEGRELLETRPSILRAVDSVFLLSADGVWYAKTAAIWRICRLLRLPWPIASVIWLVPSPVRDLAYDFYASRR